MLFADSFQKFEISQLYALVTADGMYINLTYRSGLFLYLCFSIQQLKTGPETKKTL